ncbi:hypothetical protein R6Q59_004738 [Mikania micrantha]|uniref:Uncharacterized protein n=1 Tax=Mikania micrantha TaxID=192012 RepID=A0A5N6LFB8_9ASTR|nr:hypothetical protein E3N88_43265 [Mikania micrantha]
MKISFPKIGSCFYGTVIIAPETETIAAAVSTNRRPNSGKHWTPELSAIAEDGGALNVCQQSNHSVSVVRSEKKPLTKPKSTPKPRSHSYGGSHWNFSQAMAIPAFSPTPFMF